MQFSKKLLVMLSGVFVFALTAWSGSPAPAETASRGADNGSPAGFAIDDVENPLIDTSSYEVYLNGFKFGKATLEVKRAGENFLLQGTANLRPALGNLYPVAYKAQTVTSVHPVQPSEVVMEEEKGSKKMTFRLRFPRPDHATAVQLEAGSGKETRRTHKEFFSESYVLDPLSTVFLIRSREWRVGDVQVFDILTGRKQYELQLTCRGESVLTVDGGQREVWEIVPQTRSYEPPRKIKLSGYVMYLAKDSRREILKITGRHKLGRVVAQLEKMDGQVRE